MVVLVLVEPIVGRHPPWRDRNIRGDSRGPQIATPSSPLEGSQHPLVRAVRRGQLAVILPGGDRN